MTKVIDGGRLGMPSLEPNQTKTIKHGVWRKTTLDILSTSGIQPVALRVQNQNVNGSRNLRENARIEREVKDDAVEVLVAMRSANRFGTLAFWLFFFGKNRTAQNPNLRLQST